MNWFSPSLWFPIYAAVKCYRNFTLAIHYLRARYKKPGETFSIYDRLIASSLRSWFTPKGVLKNEYKHCVEEGTTYFTGGAQHCPLLSKYHALKENIVATLRGHRKVGQPLFARSARNLIITMFKKQQLDYSCKKVQQALEFL